MPTDTAVARKPSLYSLADDLTTIIETIDGSDDPDSRTELLEMFEAKATELVHKVDPFVGYIIRENSEIESLEAQREAMNAAFDLTIQRRRKHLEDLDNIAHRVLDTLGVRKLNGTIHSIGLVKNPGRLNVLDEKKIPAKFWQVIPESLSYNKNEIKAAIKAGEDVYECAEIVAGTDRIEIR